MPPPFSPTRPRSRAASRGRPICTYVGTVLPAWQPQKTNWCHGLTAESENCRPVGQHHCAAENGRSVSFFPLWPPFYDSDGPGEAWNGSGRSRGPSLRPDGVRTVPTARGRNPRHGKGVKSRETASGHTNTPKSPREDLVTPSHYCAQICKSARTEAARPTQHVAPLAPPGPYLQATALCCIQFSCTQCTSPSNP